MLCPAESEYSRAICTIAAVPPFLMFKVLAYCPLRSTTSPLKKVNGGSRRAASDARCAPGTTIDLLDRKSTRLNSSHVAISYAVFCLKKKKSRKKQHTL